MRSLRTYDLQGGAWAAAGVDIDLQIRSGMILCSWGLSCRCAAGCSGDS